MKNIKIDNQLTGKEFWPSVGYVDIKGNPNAVERAESVSDAEKEAIIQSWKNIAVLKVTPRSECKFGFIQDGLFEFLNVSIQPDQEGQFGVRVGDKDTRFFVLPADLHSQFSLELVKITDEADPSYPNLPLY